MNIIDNTKNNLVLPAGFVYNTQYTDERFVIITQFINELSKSSATLIPIITPVPVCNNYMSSDNSTMKCERIDLEKAFANNED